MRDPQRYRLNTLLLPPETWIHSRRSPNRLKLLKSYVERGGGLVMVGGYYSFQGINGGARYRNTAVEAALPTVIHPYDDRLEIPEGIAPIISGSASHPVLKGVPGGLPFILGLNEVVAKEGATTLLSLPAEEGGHPLLVVGEHGKGRSAAWTNRHRAALVAGQVPALGRLQAALEQPAPLGLAQRLITP